MKSPIEKNGLFLLSPFLTLPLLLKDIYRGKERSFILLSIVFGILSYAYIPTEANDKAYYYSLFEQFKNHNIGDLFLFLNDKPDFLFYALIYFFSKIGISVQFLFLLVSAFTVWVWFYSFNKIAHKYNLLNKKYFLFFLLILFSLSLSHLFSGVRNYFSFAFIVLAFIKGIYYESKKVGLFFIIVAIAIHFSSFIFFPIYLLLILYPRKYKLYKVIFLVSFVFLVIPRDSLLDLMKTANLPEMYSNKVEGYLGEEDFIETSLDLGNFNNYLRIIFFTLWTYFAWFYLLWTFKRESMLRNLTLIAFAVSNIFYSAPATYFRYLLLVQIFFILLLMYEYSIYQRLLNFSRILLFVFMINFLGNIYSQRQQYATSYLNFYSLTSITIFMKDRITKEDFLK